MPADAEPVGGAILSVRDLAVDFSDGASAVRAIDGVSFEVFPNEVLCIVGESGSGKSLSLLATMGLLPGGARIVSGDIAFMGHDMRRISPSALRALRGKDLAMIFQDPLSALNPVMRIGAQLREAIALHTPSLSRAALQARAVALLAAVHVPDPEQRTHAYPHEFSGGMRQRVMIAMAMAHHPRVLIADEPTTALDVTIQGQILRLLREIRAQNGSSMVLITHDLGVVAEIADRVVVMYAGRVVESGTARQVLEYPRHPYTIGLLASRVDPARRGTPVHAIPGQPATAANRPSGCAFHPRCGLRQGRDACCDMRPALAETAHPNHLAACLFAAEAPLWAADAARPATPRAGGVA